MRFYGIMSPQRMEGQVLIFKDLRRSDTVGLNPH
jgi:hypothetical protein